jgi:hypothetical protein
MAENHRGDRLVFNTRERITSDDLNTMQKLRMFDIANILGLTSVWGTQGAVLRNLIASEQDTPGATIKIGIGQAIIYSTASSPLDGVAANGIEGHPGWHLANVEDVQTVTFAANTSGDPRIDCVMMKPIASNADLETKDIFDEDLDDFTATPNTPKRKRMACTVANGGIYVKQGTPGVIPVEPDDDLQAIKLCAVLLEDAYTTILDAEIFDRRTPVVAPSYKARIDTDGTLTGLARKVNGADVEIDDHPSAGVYEFLMEGFSTSAGFLTHEGASTTTHVSVKVTLYKATTDDCVAAVSITDGGRLTIKFSDAADHEFFLEVDDIGMSGCGQ